MTELRPAGEYAERIRNARSEIARQMVVAARSLDAAAYNALAKALVAVDTHLVDPDMRPEPDSEPEVCGIDLKPHLAALPDDAGYSPEARARLAALPDGHITLHGPPDRPGPARGD